MTLFQDKYAPYTWGHKFNILRCWLLQIAMYCVTLSSRFSISFYLFIFDCAGSSHCGGFSCYGAQALRHEGFSSCGTHA